MTDIKYDFEAAVIGSGFGGSIAAIELAKTFKEKYGKEKEVLILERGIWYMSPEAWLEPGNRVANYIKKHNKPYRFWVMPDNSKGSLNLVAQLRSFPLGSGILSSILELWLTYRGKRVNPNALYDIKEFNDSFALVASGVGGGSLVYSNVTIPPEPEILDLEYKESDRDSSALNPDDTWKPRWKIRYDELEPYMMYAKHNLIEVSKIYSTQAGYYNEEMMLPKTKELRHAAENLYKNDYEAKFEFIDLSITEAPSFNPDSKSTTKFCRRQGRCNFGCLPGARHSLNKILVEAIEEDGLPIIIRENADVSVIEPIRGGKDGYRIYYNRPGDGEQNYNIIHVKTLILAAGSYGTTGLILRSKENHKGDPEREETFEDVSPNIGTGLSLNGDTFGFVIDTKNPVYMTRGPVDTGHVRFKKSGKHHFTIEDATIPRLVAGSIIAALQRYLYEEYKDVHKGHAHNISEHIEDFLDHQVVEGTGHHFDRGFLIAWALHPVFGFTWEYIVKNNSDVFRFLKAIFTRGLVEWPKRRWGKSQYGSQAWLMGTKEHNYELRKNPRHKHRAMDDLEVDYLLSRIFWFACMGVDSANGEAKWDPKRKRLDVNWSGLANDPIYNEMRDGMKMLGDVMVDNDAKKKGETRKYLVLDPMKDLFKQQFGDKKDGKKVGKIISLHPLGGCPMETEGTRTGVVDIYGRLLKKDGSVYENLYIVDGSIIPTALAVNPSLTISGLAFRIMDYVTQNYRKEGSSIYSVRKGEKYNITFKEMSHCSKGIYTVATVDPIYYNAAAGAKRKIVYDNIVYVYGRHIPENTELDGQEYKGRVEIMKVEGKLAYGQLVS